MALDYGNYLLSSSPPGFEYIHLRNFEHSSETYGGFSRRKKDLSFNGFAADVCKAFQFDDSAEGHCKKIESEQSKSSNWQSVELVDSRTKVSSRKPFVEDRFTDWENTYNCDPGSCDCSSKKLSGKMKLKNVTFADDFGHVLAEVRTMKEPSDVPPNLRPEILDNFTPLPPQSIFLDLDTPIHLSIDFSQPAADYLAFREKLEKNSVCLENAVVRGMQLFGTSKVKNQSYDKRVFVRCTFDGWESSLNYPATYSNSNNTCFDTFSFQIDVPLDLNPGKSVQFAICFESDGVQFWDNNDGKNYEVSHHHRCTGEGNAFSSAQGAFAFHRQDLWSNYTGWSEKNSNPYW